MVIYNGSSVYLRYILWLLCPHCSLQRGQAPALRHHLYPFVFKCMWSLRCPNETPPAWKVTELIFLLPDVPKWYLHDLILSGCGSEGVAECLCSALDRWCLSEPVYSPNPWHDFPWDPVCSVCPVVACSFQLSECSTDIPESSGSPSTPPLALGHLGKETNPPHLWPPSQEGIF